MDQNHVPYIYLFGVLYSNACTKQRLMASMTCKIQKRLIETSFDIEQDVIDTAIRHQTRLPCEFVANQFSDSRDIRRKPRICPW